MGKLSLQRLCCLSDCCGIAGDWTASFTAAQIGAQTTNDTEPNKITYTDSQCEETMHSKR